MAKNKDDSKVREIFNYLLQVASYEQNAVIRQKVRVL